MVKDKLNEDEPITAASLIVQLFQIDNRLAQKTYKILQHMCYAFMEKFENSFRIGQDILMSNNQTREWQNHEIFKMDKDRFASRTFAK